MHSLFPPNIQCAAHLCDPCLAAWCNVFAVVACCAPAGKSTLLVALLHFLLEQRSREGSPLAGARMLVRCGCFVGWGHTG